jgi:hypothetical protein
MDYKIGKLLGRLASGLESDKGVLAHAVVRKRVKHRPCPANEWGRKVLGDGLMEASVGVCGARPGKRSVGWDFEVDSNHLESKVTCPKCLSRLEKQVAKKS